MRLFVEQDLTGAEFRECALDGARFVGVVMQNVEIDGVVTHLLVNGIEVTGSVETELDRRYPVRLLIRSDETVDLRGAWRQLGADWRRQSLGCARHGRRARNRERRMVDGRWETLRHLVFVHDSWFRSCCLGSTERFTPIGIGPAAEPYRQAHGLDLSLEPSLDEAATVRKAQAAELESWLESVTLEQLAATAPSPTTTTGRPTPEAAPCGNAWAPSSTSSGSTTDSRTAI